MLVHVSLTLIPPPHLVRDGVQPEGHRKVVELAAAPDAIAAGLRGITTPDLVELLNAGAAINVLVQRYNPRPSGV